jgi:hypothetical protein
MRHLTILAQDPSILVGGRILRERVAVPVENLAPGPWGHRVQILDYDASAERLYAPLDLPTYADDADGDPYTEVSDRELLRDPKFHAQNAYAIVMRTLGRFEFALGRRVSWGFGSHQIRVAPHAFSEANAFYSERDQCLLFGYFPARAGGTVFSCLSHDIVAHETTHALLDGIRNRFSDPSSPDQASFHEAFADVVALLSVFSLPRVVMAGLQLAEQRGTNSGVARSRNNPRTVARSALAVEQLRRNVLLGLADEMGQEMSDVRGQPLRRSATLTPSTKWVDDPAFAEPHRRGEILVAAMMNAFLGVWAERVEQLGDVGNKRVDLERAAEEGSASADYLLTMAIRALDYTPPVHLEFCDFLSALLTADRELRPDDSRYRFRDHLRASFASYGIRPATTTRTPEAGLWRMIEDDSYSYEHTHFDSLQHDPVEICRFLWENRQPLELCDGAYTRVASVRPCLRVGPDGFSLRETVAEYVQSLDLLASELASYGIAAPEGMPMDTPVQLSGGGTLVFDEFGRLKLNVHNRLLNADRQTRRLRHLWNFGAFDRGARALRYFSRIHRLRATDAPTTSAEEWL